MNPLVSVVITAYNYGQYLGEAINSVLCQSYTDFELIILNNNSTDNTSDVVAMFIGDSRIAYVENECNIGSINNFNKGIATARGKYLIFLSADDFFLKNTLSILVNEMEQNPRVDFAYGRYFFVDKNSNFTEMVSHQGWDKFDHFEYSNEVGRLLAYDCYISFPATMFKRDVFNRFGNLDTGFEISDYEFFLRLMSNGARSKFIDSTLAAFRVHGKQASISIDYIQSGLQYESQLGLLEKYVINNNVKHLIGYESEIINLLNAKVLNYRISGGVLEAERRLRIQKIKQKLVTLTSEKYIDSMDLNGVVSVIIPTLNRQILVIEALKSIVNQSYSIWEAIVVNDGGLSMAPIIESIDERIKCIDLKSHIGQSAARNVGLKFAKGDVICFLDDDDIFLPQHLAVVVENLNNSNFLYTNAEYVVSDKQGNVVRREIRYGMDYSKENLFVENYIPINTWAVKRSYLLQCGFFDESLGCLEDWELLIRLSKGCELLHIPETTVEVHERQGMAGVSIVNGSNFYNVFKKVYEKHGHLNSQSVKKLQEKKLSVLSGKPQVAISKTIDFPVDWNETFYLNSNPDVVFAINSGRFSSGYEHFLRFGSKEGRKISSSKPNSINDLTLRVNHNSKVAVVVHLYYIDLWAEIASYLELFSESFDLFVSLVDAVDLQFVSQDILNIYPLANIFLCENRGRDVAPFITLLNSGILDSYDAICKIHTKRSKHTQFGDMWRKDCFERLIGDKVSIERYINCIRNQNVGLIGPVGYLIADHQSLTTKNKENLLIFIQQLNIRDIFGCFFAGSMFWVKPSALKPIADLGLTINDFEVESGQLDSTLAHALERLFALVVMKQGYIVSDTDQPYEAIDQNYNKPLSVILSSIFDEQKEKQIAKYVSTQEKDAYQKWIKSHNVFTDYEDISPNPQNNIIHVVTYVEPAQLSDLADSLDSLSLQNYNGWKLSVISTLPCPDPVFDEFDNLRWISVTSGDQVVSSINRIVEEIESDWLCILGVGVILEPSTFSIFIRYIASYKDFKLIYADDDLVDGNKNRMFPQFKPDFTVDYIRSYFYIGDSFLVEKDVFLRIGGLIEYPGTYDLVLRVMDGYGEKSIGHVKEILFHYPENYIGWRENNGKEALINHFSRNSLDVNIQTGYLENTFNIEYFYKNNPLVTIILPTKDRLDLLKPCLDSLLEKSTYKHYEVIIVNNQSKLRETLEYFEKLQSEYTDNIKVIDYDKAYNYSAINNMAAELSKGDFLLLLNNDTVIIQPNWLERMLNFGLRNDVGIVGARLVFPNQTLQHAGVVLGMGSFGVADHPYIGLPLTEPGYMNRAQVAQNFSAVTAACMLIRKSVYFEVGGLDEENFKVLFNDVDLCLKVREKGYKIVWTPYATVVHHGSSSIKADKNPDKVKRAREEANKMLEKWLPQLANDPAYNRNLSLKHRHFQIETETDVTWNVDFHDRPRVYAFPANDSGIGEYRVRAPLRALTHAAMIESSLLPNHSATLIPDIVEIERVKPDTLLLQNGTADYLIHAWQQYRKFNDVFMIYSQDDLVHMLPGKHPLQAKWPKDVRRRLSKLMAHSDRLIVATEPLQEAYSKYISDIKLVPNYLEKARWLDLKSNKQIRNGKKFRVGWAGGGQHHGDLEFIAPVIEATKDEVDWVFMGMCLDQIRPFIKEYHAGVAFDLYPQKLADLDLDLAIAPLEYNNFNMAKTNLRLLEYGVLGWPVLCSDITPYQGAPVTLVGNNVNHWVKAIRDKINEPEALLKEGQVLQQWVLNNYLLEDHLDEWLAALTS